MASLIQLFIFAFLLASSIQSMAMQDRPLDLKSSTTAARLLLDDESSVCWDSLIQLQSCTRELIIFFVNAGKTNLGHGCCQTVLAISQQRCWPTIVDSLGFTQEETVMLQGYCNHESSSLSPSPLPLPLPPAVELTNVS